ncbi:enolase-phosphatase E1 [Drosophila tropicalis]|uniref:enolase-phosphatase E1 n=1 Tax=Drosophila tropicalis TaxID=46794 RepID=UPI0035ABD061
MTPKISHVYFNQQQFCFPHIQHTRMPKNDLSFPSRISSVTSINQQKQKQQQQQLTPASIRSNEVVVHMESPTIKYQFVNLLNNLYGKWVNANVAGHGNQSSQPTPTTPPTDLTVLVPSPKTTTTTASMTASTSQHDEITEIDMDEKETHCRTFDNEPNALEQIKTFNLNVKVQQEDEKVEEQQQGQKEKEALAKGVGEQKMEIEHQQAENFNDAFGRQQRYDDDHRYDYSVDAMDVAKNKHELYEQSKLERNQQKESRDELNMNKAASKILANEEHNEWSRECQRQRVKSICLASREQTIDEYGTASNHQLLAVDLSDTRETSSEQVDEQQQQLRHHHHHHQQHQHHQYQPHVKSNGSIVTRPNIEIFKSAVHTFLAAGECDCPFPLARKQFDLELIDFLSDIIEVLFSSVGAVGQTKQVATSCECADMTVSKVSEEQDSEAAAIVVAAAVGDVYPDQIDSPSEVEDNNISSNSIIKVRNDNQQINDMKYELKPSVATTTLPLASSNRHANSVHPSTSEAPPTSRIRNNLETTTAVRPTPLLLSDLKRTSSSRDDVSESVLPERTRLRRQRRMRSQDSVEEKPEDVIERLNKLKARISGALSEVKGVLKQYSTESETETPIQTAVVKATDPATATSSASAAPAPPAVAFRFVKKVRRRSCFDEAEEEQESKTNQSAPLHEQKQEENKDVDEKEEQIRKLSALDTAEAKVKDKLNTKQNHIGENSAEKFKALTTENHISETQKSAVPTPSEPPPPPVPAPGHVSPRTTTPSVQTKIDFLKKVCSELKGKPANEENKTTETATATTEAPSTTTMTPTPPTALPSESITLDTVAAVAAPVRDKIKKKIIVKAKNPRRASIAAVEPSKIKIEPLVAQIDALHTQRRPSDSEAIVKRKKEKLMGARATTTTISSGIAKETTKLQPKLQQKPATTTTPTNEQLSTPKVNNADAIPAKIKTKSLAKSDKGDEATTASIPANTGVTDKSTPAASTTEGAASTQPEQINIVGVDTNQVQTIDRTSHNHTEKVAELVIAEPPVVVVVVVPPPAGSSNSAAEDSSHISSSPVISSSLSESKKPINQSDASSFEAPPTPDHLVAIADDIEAAAAEKSAPPQIAATLSEVSHEESSLQQQPPQSQQQQQQQQQSESVADTKDKTHTDTSDSLAAMPELKVLSGPVQPVKIETVVDQTNDETKNGNQQQISVAKKKTPHLKKLVRKNSIDKDKDKDKEKEKDEPTNNDDKLKSILRNKNKITELSSRLNKLTPPKKIAKPSQEAQQVVTTVKEQKENGESEINAEVIDDGQQTGTEVEEELSPLTDPEPEPQPEPTPAPKQRKIKKKVIIKRQKRRLSISDSFFIQPETEEPKVPEIETIEKAIAYVTDDEVDNVDPDETDTAKPLKSCLHVREYKIGDLVLYAERYRKTQVRWKRGRVLERITSISYKLEIEGKEVPAHISYIKKYTGRKVRFGGKEYLEIDYEQVAEEERRARSYSIWNMV